MALQALFDMIRRFKIGYELRLHKRTVERGLLSLIGPEARAHRRASRGVARPMEHANAPVEIDGIAALAARTDTGRGSVCDAADTERLAEALCERGAEPVAEAGRGDRARRARPPRYGVDMDESTIPQEAGLNERAVSFTKGCYVGQETVARLYYKGKPNRLLRGLRLSAARAAGHGAAPGREGGGTVEQRRALPRVRSDRPGARAPRGAASERAYRSETAI